VHREPEGGLARARDDLGVGADQRIGQSASRRQPFVEARRAEGELVARLLAPDFGRFASVGGLFGPLVEVRGERSAHAREDVRGVRHAGTLERRPHRGRRAGRNRARRRGLEGPDSERSGDVGAAVPNAACGLNARRGPGPACCHGHSGEQGEGEPPPAGFVRPQIGQQIVHRRVALRGIERQSSPEGPPDRAGRGARRLFAVSRLYLSGRSRARPAWTRWATPEQALVES
jgi:hypothetical protein